MRSDPPPALNSMEPRYLRPLKETVAPPDEAESDDPWVVPLRGLLVAPVDSGLVGSIELLGNVTEAPAPEPAPPDSTEVTMGADGIAPSDPVAPFAALAVTAVGTGLAAAGFVGPGLLDTPSPGLVAPGTVGAGFVGAGFVEAGFVGIGVVGVGTVGAGFVGVGVVAAALDGAVAADVAGTVMTEETIGVSAWKRSAALTISL
jgi:hypothetical protein